MTALALTAWSPVEKYKYIRECVSWVQWQKYLHVPGEERLQRTGGGSEMFIRVGQGRPEGRGDGGEVNSKLVPQTWTPQPLQLLWDFKDFYVTRCLHSSLISYLLCASFWGSQPCQLLKIPQMQHCFACPFSLSLPSFHSSFLPVNSYFISFMYQHCSKYGKDSSIKTATNTKNHVPDLDLTFY